MKARFDTLAGTGSIVGDIMCSPDIPESADIQLRIRLCVEELVSNVVNYAYCGGQGWLEVETSIENGFLCILLRDAGVPFNPLEKPDPDLSVSIQDRQTGGLGIYLCKQSADSIEYERRDGYNELVLKFVI